MCLGSSCFDLIQSVTSKETTQVPTEAASKYFLNKNEHWSKIMAVSFLLLVCSYGNICRTPTYADDTVFFCFLISLV